DRARDLVAGVLDRFAVDVAGHLDAELRRRARRSVGVGLLEDEEPALRTRDLDHGVHDLLEESPEVELAVEGLVEREEAPELADAARELAVVGLLEARARLEGAPQRGAGGLRPPCAPRRRKDRL